MDVGVGGSMLCFLQGKWKTGWKPATTSTITAGANATSLVVSVKRPAKCKEMRSSVLLMRLCVYDGVGRTRQCRLAWRLGNELRRCAGQWRRCLPDHHTPPLCRLQARDTQ